MRRRQPTAIAIIEWWSPDRSLRTTDGEGKGTWTDPGVEGTGARFYREVRK
jgi:hypothetical protein